MAVLLVTGAIYCCYRARTRRARIETKEVRIRSPQRPLRNADFDDFILAPVNLRTIKPAFLEGDINMMTPRQGARTAQMRYLANVGFSPFSAARPEPAPSLPSTPSSDLRDLRPATTPWSGGTPAILAEPEGRNLTPRSFRWQRATDQQRARASV